MSHLSTIFRCWEIQNFFVVTQKTWVSPVSMQSFEPVPCPSRANEPQCDIASTKNKLPSIHISLRKFTILGHSILWSSQHLLHRPLQLSGPLVSIWTSVLLCELNNVRLLHWDFSREQKLQILFYYLAWIVRHAYKFWCSVSIPFQTAEFSSQPIQKYLFQL